jgi:pimeloyl-ACP methyl ester carboxylesterase
LYENDTIISSLGTKLTKRKGEYLTLNPTGAAASIFPGLPKGEARAWISKWPGQSTAIFQQALTSTSYIGVPTTYMKCMNDRVNLLEHQQRMIDGLRKVTKNVVQVVEIESGHCPMVVNAERVAETIMSAALEYSRHCQ